ncbi:TPA: AAA family ATPase [Clostridium perfringens]
MARARRGGLVRTNLGFLLYGKQGSGKSTMALDFAKMKRVDGKPFRVLYIDTEAGSVDDYLEDLQDQGIDLNNIYLVYTQSLKEVGEYINKIKNNEDFYELDEDGDETDEVILDADGEPFRADAVVIDSVSVLYIATQQGLTEFSKLRATVRADKNEITGLEKKVAVEGAGLEIKDYNTLKFDGQSLVLSLLGAGVHFALIAREQDEKEKVKTQEKGKFETVSTGNKIPDGFKDLSYNVKTVIHMIEDDMGNIMAEIKDKDRTKVHKRGEIIEDPTLLDWEAAIHRTKDRKAFVPTNDLSVSVEKEKEKYNNETDELMNQIKESTENKMSVGEYHAKIKEVVDSLDKIKKRSVKPKVEAEGMTVKYQEITDISKLQRFLEIVQSNM